MVDERAPYDVAPTSTTHTRVIPTSVKLQVWARDGGRCVECGSEDELHFDHILPYSKGGTSLRVQNVQLLCARHNLKKRDKIE
ncbi:MAG: HNH endonuclease [Gammaproteobacteria bacterium]